MDRKSIKELMWDVSESVYRYSGEMHYSHLSKYSREGRKAIMHFNDKISSAALTFGSAVDCLLTDGEEAFVNTFKMADDVIISDKLTAIVDELISVTGSKYKTLKEVPSEIVLSVRAEQKYNERISDNAVYKSILSKCAAYYDYVLAGRKYKLISGKDYKAAYACERELKTNPYTRMFFTDDIPDHIEIIYQAKFKSTFENYPTACMFDLLIVDHKTKKIYPIDLKTTGKSEDDFKESFYIFRYYIQSEFYTYNLKNEIAKSEYFKDFQIASFQFIVINQHTLAPLVYIDSKNHSEEDRIEKNGTYTHWRTLFRDIIYYKKQTDLKYSKEQKEHNGRVKLN